MIAAVSSSSSSATVGVARRLNPKDILCAHKARSCCGKISLGHTEVPQCMTRMTVFQNYTGRILQLFVSSHQDISY